MSRFKITLVKKENRIISPGRPRIQLDLNDQTLRLLYDNGESIVSLAQKCHCSETTIRRHLGLEK